MAREHSLHARVVQEHARARFACSRLAWLLRRSSAQWQRRDALRGRTRHHRDARFCANVCRE